MLKGIVKFNQIGKPVHAVSVGHGLANFPQHVADSGSGNTQGVGCPQDGDVAFIRGGMR